MSPKQKWWVQDWSWQVSNISADIQMILSWQDMQGEDVHMILTLTLDDRGTQWGHSDNTVIRGQTEGRNTYDTVMRGQRGTQGVQSDNTVTRGQTEGRNTYDTVMRGQRGTQGGHSDNTHVHMYCPKIFLW